MRFPWQNSWSTIFGVGVVVFGIVVGAAGNSDLVSKFFLVGAALLVQFTYRRLAPAILNSRIEESSDLFLFFNTKGEMTIVPKNQIYLLPKNKDDIADRIFTVVLVDGTRVELPFPLTTDSEFGRIMIQHRHANTRAWQALGESAARPL